MTKFFQSTLGMFTLFLLGAAAIYLISAGFSGNWNQFASTSSTLPTCASVKLDKGLDQSQVDVLKGRGECI